MPEPSGRILACRDAERVRFRVHGRACAHQAPAVRRFAEESLARGATSVRVDLRDCEHFDSTFVGTLLCLRKQALAAGDAPLVVEAPSEACLRLLKQMGLLQLIPTSDDAADTALRWTELPAEEPGRCTLDFKRDVVHAHEELACLPGATGERYKPIAEMAAREWKDATRTGGSE
jgi:anti-anti-sigma factor